MISLMVLDSLLFSLVSTPPDALAVRAKMEELFAASSLPGLSACVILADGTEIVIAAGFANEAGTEKMEPKHRFPGGSSGKTFFAALAMQLEKEGVIDLSQKLEHYLGGEAWYAGLPNGKEITLEHLMHHTSGVSEHIGDPRFIPSLLSEPAKVWTPAEMVAYSCSKAPLFPAGGGWSYADTNYILLAMAIEKATGKYAYDMIRQRYLVPFGLAATEPSVKWTYDNVANGKLFKGDSFGEGWSMADGKYKILPQFEWAGGGICDFAARLGVLDQVYFDRKSD